MPTVQLRPEQLGMVLRATANRSPQAVQAGLRIAAQRAVARLKAITPVDRGMAKNAWQDGRQGSGWAVQNTAPYAGILERGARPHPVSAEGWMAIFRWVLRHPQLFTSRGVAGARASVNATGTRKRGSVDALREATNITNAIVHKIRTEGQEPLWLVRDNMPHFTRWAAEEIARALAAFMARQGGGGVP